MRVARGSDRSARANKLASPPSLNLFHAHWQRRLISTRSTLGPRRTGSSGEPYVHTRGGLTSGDRVRSESQYKRGALSGLMAGCSMEMLAVGSVGREVGLEGVRGSTEPAAACARAQGVAVRATVLTRWPSARVVAQPAGIRLRCKAASGDGQPKKNYDINEVVEKVVHDEENQLPEEEKNTPEPLPEGEPSPFSPAIDTDDTEAFQGEGVSKDSLIEPPRGLQEGAASASIGEGLGASEESALSADIGGSLKSAAGGHGRDWRVQSSKGGRSATDSTARVEKAIGTEAQREQQKQMFGSSEASCDEGSSFMAEAGILENDGGKSVDDYQLRAHIFSESSVFFSALKNRESHSVV